MLFMNFIKHFINMFLTLFNANFCSTLILYGPIFGIKFNFWIYFMNFGKNEMFKESVKFRSSYLRH